MEPLEYFHRQISSGAYETGIYCLCAKCAKDHNGLYPLGSANEDDGCDECGWPYDGQGNRIDKGE